MIDFDDRRRGKNRRAFDDILEFPNIPRPIVLRQPCQCRVAKGKSGSVEFHPEELQKVWRQERDILIPVSEGGNHDRKHREALEEVRT